MVKWLARLVAPTPIWRWLTHARWQTGRAITCIWKDARLFGWWATAQLAVGRLLGSTLGVRSSARRLWSLKIRGFHYPIYYRAGTSDPDVIRQVFIQQQYSCVASDSDVRFIIDCGANIGCTTFYLLHKHPRARAVVVEPDSDNLRVLRQNLSPFADRVTVIPGGVWSASVPLVVERGAFSDGREWSFQVRPVRSGEVPEFHGLAVDDLIAAAGFSRVDILKVDIEGAETEVFRPGCESWLAHVRTLVIELHGPECEQAVGRVIASFPYSTERFGELTLIRFSSVSQSPC